MMNGDIMIQYLQQRKDYAVINRSVDIAKAAKQKEVKQLAKILDNIIRSLCFYKVIVTRPWPW